MGQIKYETVSKIRANVGKNIVDARKARGISQSMLVAKLNVYGCNVSRFSVSSIENSPFLRLEFACRYKSRA